MRQRVIKVPGLETGLVAYDIGSHGPRAFITAGVHGGEGTSIRVAELLISELAKVESSLHGTFTIVPVSHPQAFAELERNSPLDGMNLNRSFPGDAAGKPTQAIAAALWGEIRDSQYLIDLHCVWTDAVIHVIAPWSKFSHAEQFGASFAFDVLVDSSYREGGLAYIEANEIGIPAVVIEFPGLGSRGRVDTAAAVWGCQAVLLALHRAGLAPEPEVHPDVAGKVPAFVHPPTSLKLPAGYFEPSVRPGTWLREGHVVGTVNGQPVHAPVEGLVLTIPPVMYFPRPDHFGCSICVSGDKPRP